jgi:hypothetical protein
MNVVAPLLSEEDYNQVMTKEYASLLLVEGICVWPNPICEDMFLFCVFAKV